jgi:hypothetical protein
MRGPTCGAIDNAKRAALPLAHVPIPMDGHAVALESAVRPAYLGGTRRIAMDLDQKTRTELEAAVYRRLVEHLRQRTDVQNIDLMNLAGFCRNCLSNWMKDAADAKGIPMSKEASREIVYGEPYDQWRAKYQKEASPDQKAAFTKNMHKH